MRDVGAARRVQHEDGEKAQQRGEPDRRAPLARRNPHAVRREQQHHDGEAGRIPDVLAVDAEDEFRADGDDGGNCMQPRLVGAQQQAQREPGDQRRARIELRQREQPRAERLRCQRPADGERAVERLRAEIEPAEIINAAGSTARRSDNGAHRTTIRGSKKLPSPFSRALRYVARIAGQSDVIRTARRRTGGHQQPKRWGLVTRCRRSSWPGLARPSTPRQRTKTWMRGTADKSTQSAQA